MKEFIIVGRIKIRFVTYIMACSETKMDALVSIINSQVINGDV